MNAIIFMNREDDELIRCDECGEEYSVKEVNSDKVRFYKITNGKLICELCLEDFADKLNI